MFNERRDILTEARTRLRDKFLAADVGITGANFLIAETGSSVIVTNEGNGDLTQTLPRVHIALAQHREGGADAGGRDDRCCACWRARATGQDFSVYTTFSTGARRPGDLDGPEEYHVVLIDNGRSNMIGTEFQEMLRCIRCAACMNHCPVYGAIGGHAYGWVYPGPMGSVLTPSLVGVDKTGAPAQRLDLLRQVRERLPGEDPAAQPDAALARAGIRAAPDAGGDAARTSALWAWFAKRPQAVSHRDARWRSARCRCSAAARARSARCPSPAAGPRGATCRRPRAAPSWRATRSSSASGERMSKDAILGAIRRGLKRGPLPADQRAMLDGRLATHPRHLIPARSRVPRPEQLALFIRNVEKEFGTVARVADAAEIPGAIADYLAQQNLRAALRARAASRPRRAALGRQARCCEFEARRAEATDAVSVQHGFAAIAETGTLMLPSDATRPTTLNLLAETEIVVLRASRVVGAYEEAWDIAAARTHGRRPPAASCRAT